MRQHILLTNYPCFENDNVWPIITYNINHSNVEMCINNSEYKFSAYVASCRRFTGEIER